MRTYKKQENNELNTGQNPDTILRNEYNKIFYDSTSQIYDLFLNKILIPIVTKTRAQKHYRILSGMLSNIHNQSILDLACGTGNIINLLPPENIYTGLDLSDKMILQAEKRVKNSHLNCRFVIGDAQNTSCQSNEFDIVICNLALHFFPDHQKVLEEVARVLKPGGTFIGCLPVVGYDKLFDRIWKKLSRKTYRLGIPLSEQEIQCSCERYGFTYKHICHNGIIIYFKASSQRQD